MKADSERTLSIADQAGRHRAGSAWTDRGTERLISGGTGEWAASIFCHRRAVEILGELPVGENESYLADLGAAWVNLGCALQAGSSPDNLAEARDAFDRAVGFLERLPFETNPRFRHNLAAAWMNRADTSARDDSTASLTEAAQGYRRAIEIARELPLEEKPSFRILLASCWINLGNLHQRRSDYPEAVRAYDEALSALGVLPRGGHRLACHHAATAWTNRGEALLLGAPFADAAQAVESARLALSQVEGRNLDGPADAKLRLRALRVMARGLESLLRDSAAPATAEKVTALTDVAERGLDLAFGSRESAPALFDPFIIWFFSVGSRVYGRYQPQFLTEYLAEVLQRWKSQATPGIEAELRAVAREAAAGALEGLSGNRLIISGTTQADLFLSTVRDLRNAAANFNS